MKSEYLADLVGLLVMLAVAALCAWLGYLAGQRDVDALRAQYARAHATAAEHASRQLLAAVERGDQLTLELAAARRAADQRLQELHDDIPRVTDGRACLREPALRLLDGAPGLSVRVPAPAGGAAAADAGRVATDTDLAGWAVDAGARYAECARRFDALTRWHAAPEAAP